MYYCHLEIFNISVTNDTRKVFYVSFKKKILWSLTEFNLKENCIFYLIFFKNSSLFFFFFMYVNTSLTVYRYAEFQDGEMIELWEINLNMNGIYEALGIQRQN